MMFDARHIVCAAGEDVVKVYDKADGRHWDCGAGANTTVEDRMADTNTSVVEHVRLKDGGKVPQVLHPHPHISVL